MGSLFNFFQPWIKDIALGWVRHAVAGGGVWLVSQGLVSQSDATKLTGAAMVLAGIAWSAYDKYKDRNLVKPLSSDQPAQATPPRTFTTR